jgi:methanethiol S-methyltransferase
MRYFYVFYAVFAYVFFLGTFLYLVGFVDNLPQFSTTIDRGITSSLFEAVAINLALIGAFAVQHSVMARPAFKRWWTRIVPEPIERSTYVLAATLVLALLLWQWRPVAEPMIWSINDPVVSTILQFIFWMGWAILLLSTFLLNHFELFGLRQVWAHMRGHALPFAVFRTPLLYRQVRHPIYLGFALAFWATPQMSAGHLLFAVAFTGYTLVGIWFEERDLIAQFGDRYRVYREQVGMLLPKFGSGRSKDSRHV